jgi:hypothetical protein
VDNPDLIIKKEFPYNISLGDQNLFYELYCIPVRQEVEVRLRFKNEQSSKI